MSSVYDDVNRMNTKSDDTRLDDVEKKISDLDDDLRELIGDTEALFEEWKEQHFDDVIKFVDENLKSILGRLEKIKDRLY